MTRIACYADLHGFLPLVVDCDLAIIAGDICPDYRKNSDAQRNWFNTYFIPWISNFKSAVFIAGNHDYFLTDGVEDSPNIHYLSDNLCNLNGLNIWGSPWSLHYGSYAFMEDEEFLGRKLDKISHGPAPDIIVSHSPPFGYGDAVHRPAYDVIENTGSKALLSAIRLYQPLLVVNGHIHEGRGVTRYGKTLIVNAALGHQHQKPIVVEIYDNKVDIIDL